MHLKKGSPEAKAYMAKIRGMARRPKAPRSLDEAFQKSRLVGRPLTGQDFSRVANPLTAAEGRDELLSAARLYRTGERQLRQGMLEDALYSAGAAGGVAAVVSRKAKSALIAARGYRLDGRADGLSDEIAQRIYNEREDNPPLLILGNPPSSDRRIANPDGWKQDKSGHATWYFLEKDGYYARVESNREGDWEWTVDAPDDESVGHGTEKTLSAAKLECEAAINEDLDARGDNPKSSQRKMNPRQEYHGGRGKWAPSQVWAAAKRAGLPREACQRAVDEYMATGLLWPEVLDIIRYWPAPVPDFGTDTRPRTENPHVELYGPEMYPSVEPKRGQLWGVLSSVDPTGGYLTIDGTRVFFTVSDYYHTGAGGRSYKQLIALQKWVGREVQADTVFRHAWGWTIMGRSHIRLMPANSRGRGTNPNIPPGGRIGPGLQRLQIPQTFRFYGNIFEEDQRELYAAWNSAGVRYHSEGWGRMADVYVHPEDWERAIEIHRGLDRHSRGLNPLTRKEADQIIGRAQDREGAAYDAEHSWDPDALAGATGDYGRASAAAWVVQDFGPRGTRPKAVELRGRAEAGAVRLEESDIEYHKRLRGRGKNPGSSYRKMNPPPGISKWNMSAGGTSAAEGKHGYSYYFDGGKRAYYVEPISTKYGRHSGYQVSFVDQVQDKDTGLERGLWSHVGSHGQSIPVHMTKLFRTPAAGVAAAKKHAAYYLEGGVGPMPRRENPSSSGPKMLPASVTNSPGFKRELDAYRRRHGNGPVEIIQLETPPGSPRFASAWGKTPEIKYDAPKTSNKGRRVHRFGEGGGKEPYLVSSVEKGPKYLQIMGGTFKANGQWILK